MTEEKKAQPGETQSKNAADHRIKVIFVVILIAAGFAIYMMQHKGLKLKGWNTSIDKALVQAKTERRKVLVLFVSDSPSSTARRITTTTLAVKQNRQAIEKGKFIKVLIEIDSPNSELATRFKIKQFPTMLILSRYGRELNRREGFIGEVPFRDGFLDLTDVQKPQ